VFLCALGVAVFVQIATNYANDYSDGKRGTDDPGARVGPPRLVGNGLASPGEVKRAMLVAFGLTALCGLPLVLFVDWRLVFVGLAAIAAGWFYTGGSRPYGYAGFGEVFVFVFFGLVATVGSAYVQTLQFTWLPIVAGVAMGAWRPRSSWSTTCATSPATPRSASARWPSGWATRTPVGSTWC
jgi:1,4-dihydroxy-2-naphthoate octaprenyltransferase